LTDVTGTGKDLLHAFADVLEIREREPILIHTDRTYDWMHGDRRTRRSDNAILPSRTERAHVKKAKEQVDPRDIEIAMLRAAREMSNGPLRLRVGLLDIPKQAGVTEDLWKGSDLRRHRGSYRLREARLLVVCSKVVTPTVVLTGPTCVIPPDHRPDGSVLRVLADIRAADPEAPIIGVDMDSFDCDVGSLLGEQLPRFTLRLPDLLAQRGAPKGPMALVLPPSSAETKEITVGHAATDLRGLRAGIRGTWTHYRRAEVEGGDDRGSLVSRSVIASVTDELTVHSTAPNFRARIVRIEEDNMEDNIGLPRDVMLVCVLGVRDPVQAIKLAITTVSATDTHPLIADFLKEREGARVLLGEQRGRHALHVDRALAGVALAAYQLDQLHRIDRIRTP
jgi:hypothetical protein